MGQASELYNITTISIIKQAVAQQVKMGCWYSKDSVSSALKFLIENAYFEVGGKLFQQKVCIPIGIDPAPFLVNLFVTYYEIH